MKEITENPRLANRDATWSKTDSAMAPAGATRPTVSPGRRAGARRGKGVVFAVGVGAAGGCSVMRTRKQTHSSNAFRVKCTTSTRPVGGRCSEQVRHVILGIIGEFLFLHYMHLSTRRITDPFRVQESCLELGFGFPTRIAGVRRGESPRRPAGGWPRRWSPQHAGTVRASVRPSRALS